MDFTVQYFICTSTEMMRSDNECYKCICVSCNFYFMSLAAVALGGDSFCVSIKGGTGEVVGFNQRVKIAW